MQAEERLSLESPETLSAKVAALGRPEAEFAVRAQWALKIFIAILLVAACCAIGLLTNDFIWVLLLVTLLWVRAAARAYTQRKLRILLYPEGLVQVRGDQANAFFWNEIDVVAQEKNRTSLVLPTVSFLIKGFSRMVILKRGDGAEVSLDDSLPQFRDLVELIEEETLVYLLPRARKRYKAGETLVFGALRLSGAGIQAGSRTLAWREVHRIVIAEHVVLLMKKGTMLPWFRARPWDFSNLHVLEALVDYILETRSYRRGGP